MGRRDAVAFTLEWAAEARRLGAKVTFEPGWETRGNGTSANYDYGNVHHTGVGSSAANTFPTRRTLIVGRSDLPGPLCNVAGPHCPLSEPWLHVIAAHPANHAGASRASGPVPPLALYNPRTFGLEIDYGGNVRMTDGQYLAALIFTRAVANVLRVSVEHIRAHAETSVTGKWDPGYAPGRTIDMAAFRRDAATLTPEDDLDANQARMLDELHHKVVRLQLDYRNHHGKVVDDLLGHVLSTRKAAVAAADQLTPGVANVKTDGQVYAWARDAAARAAGLEAAVRALAEARGDDLDVDALLARVDTTVREAMADTVKVEVSVPAPEGQ